jgi:putative DNA primase/helicase
VGKHPKIKDWKERATVDPDQIDTWWSGPDTDWIYANITLLTGAESGLVVLDFDGPEGLRTLAALETKFERLAAPTSHSGGGGVHLWFAHPGRGVLVPSGDGILGPGGDVKGDNGSITVPPSSHKSGGFYRWSDTNFSTQPLAPIPTWILEQLDRARETGETAVSETEAGAAHTYRRRVSSEAYMLPSHVSDGNRNWEMFRFGSSLRARGSSDAEIAEQLHSANARLCNPPMTRPEIEAILQSVLKYEQGDRLSPPPPRSVPEEPEWLMSMPPDMELGDTLPDIGNLAVDLGTQPSGSAGQRPAPRLTLVGGSGGTNPPGDGGTSSAGGPPPPNSQPVILSGPDGLPMTDIGNAERLFRDHGEDLRYVAATERWYVWTTKRWEHDQRQRVMRKAGITARRMHPLIGDCRDEDHQKKWRLHVKYSESARGINNSIQCFGWHKDIARVVADLDHGVSHIINTQNGHLDLRTLDLRPHTRDPMITKIIPVAYHPEAECPLWISFLTKVMGGNHEMVEFLQRAVGYALTGETSEHALFFCLGSGSNGKSTFIEIVRQLAGDYGRVADFSTFTVERNRVDNARYDLAALRGARIVSAGEPERSTRFSEGTTKLMTGGDTITCRHPYGDLFEYLPQFKVFLSANHQPTIVGQDDGIWRRFRMIPFDVHIPDGEKDMQLGQKLRKERAGILAWAARGAAEWFRDGLRPPSRVMSATEKYREDMDVVGPFWHDNFTANPESHVSTGLVYDTYAKWCKAQGEHQKSKIALSRLLKERGFGEPVKRGGRKIYEGWAERVPDAEHEYDATRDVPSDYK